MNEKRLNPANLFAKECILSALMQIAQYKPLSTISVSSLCQKAGVSRMTFYRNYQSIEDVFLSRLSELFAEYKKDARSKNINGIYYDREHMLHYFVTLYQYREFLGSLFHCGLGHHFLHMMSNYILTEWQHAANPYILTAFSGSLFNLFSLWASNGFTEDAEFLARQLSALYADSETVTDPF